MRGEIELELFLVCLFYSIGSYIFFSTHKHKEIRSELEQQAGDHEQRQVRLFCSFEPGTNDWLFLPSSCH